VTDAAAQTEAGAPSSSQGTLPLAPASTAPPANGSPNSQTSPQNGSPAAANGSVPATPVPAGSPGGQQAIPAPAARPDYIPEGFWDATAGKLKDKEVFEQFNALTARVAAEDVAKLSRPQAPDAYKVELPQDFKLPPGVDFKLKTDDPLWSQARSWAHKHGLSQDAFQEGIALIAGDKVGTEQTIKAAKDAEIAKLGAAGTTRVDNVKTWLTAMGAGQLMSRLFTAGDVQVMESLITKFQRQGGAPFSAGGRIPPEAPGKVDDATYDKMSYTEKKAYAERHQSNGGGQ
jgi:hypothetical protein